MVSLRQSSRQRCDPCNGHTWDRRYALARQCCTANRSQSAWASCGDGSGGDRYVSWNGVALALPWQGYLKKHLFFKWSSLGKQAKLRKVWQTPRLSSRDSPRAKAKGVARGDWPVLAALHVFNRLAYRQHEPGTAGRQGNKLFHVDA